MQALFLKNPETAFFAEIHIQLWRLCYYKPIEYFRKKTKDKTLEGKDAVAKLLRIIDEGFGVIVHILISLYQVYSFESVDLLSTSLGCPAHILDGDYEPAPSSIQRLM